MDRSLVKYFAGIKSEATKKTYTQYLNYLLKFAKIREAEGLLQLRDTAIQEIIEDYVLHLKTRGLSKPSIRGQLSAIELYLAMNDRPLQNAKKIKKWLPAEQKATGSEAWTREDLRKMIDYSKSKRTRACFFVLISTGCRIASLPEIKLRDISEMPDNTRAILLYAGSKEEYYGFLTQEATKAVEEYLDERKKNGELLKPESPLFRRNYQVGIEKVRPMSLWTCRTTLDSVIRKVRGVGDGKRRHMQEFHGIRKFFATVCKSDNRISWSVSEMLLGHKYKMDESYFKPTKEGLWKEWRKILEGLVISDEERQRLRAERAEKKAELMESEKDLRIKQLEEQQRQTQEQIKGLYELLGKN